MKADPKPPLVKTLADCVLGISLAGLALLLPLPGGARPLLPPLLLLAAHLVFPAASLLSSGPALFFGLGLGPILFLSDLSIGSVPEWLLCTGGALFLLALLPLVRRPAGPPTHPARSALLVAFLFGLAHEGLRAATRPVLGTAAGTGAAAELCLQSTMALAFGAGLLLGIFLARRIPPFLRYLIPAALLASAVSGAWGVQPAPALYRMVLFTHKPDDTALAFAAGNLFIALRICGLACILQGAAFAMALSDLGHRGGLGVRIFLAWSAGILLLRLVPLDEVVLYRPALSTGLLAGLPPLLLGTAWFIGSRPRKLARAATGLPACIALAILASIAGRPDPFLKGNGIPSPAVFQTAERFGIDPEILSTKDGVDLYRLFGDEDEQVVIHGRLVADGRLSYRMPWSTALANLIGFFCSVPGLQLPPEAEGLEKGLLPPLPGMGIRHFTQPAPTIFLPSFIRQGEAARGELIAAFEERKEALAVILDLSTLSREGLANLFQPLLERRPGTTCWIEMPYLLLAAGPRDGRFGLKGIYEQRMKRNDWRLPCPVPPELFLDPPDGAAMVGNALSQALALELAGRRGPFPDPRTAAAHLGPIITALPHPPCRARCSPEETFLYGRSLILGAALRRYQGRIADELRLLNVLSAEFPDLPEIGALKTRAMKGIEADRERWLHLYHADRTDADARLWIGRHLWADGDPEGIHYIKSACELRDTLTEAFEESTEGFAEMLRSATGESRVHQLRTVESLVRYAFMKKRLTPRLWALRGMAHLHAGGRAGALEYSEIALEKDAGLALAHRTLAALRLDSGQADLALEAARESIRLDPHDPESRLIQAKALAALGAENGQVCSDALSAYLVLTGSSEAFPGRGD